MPPTIVNPILNSPYREPGRYFRFDEDGITAEIVEGRRLSTYFVPIPAPKKKGGAQLSLGMQGDWTAERMKANDFINDIRRYVAAWRQSNYPGITAVTRELLRYWRNDERASPVFFCQFEALETAIFIAEVAGHSQPWIEARLREENEDKNAGLYRIAFKMATGSGKTVVMAMLIAWQALNKLASPHDKRFSDTFLVVTPGITIRDRLRVLQPNDLGNYYVERDLVTPDQLLQLQQATILITNFHAFIARETIAASTTTTRTASRRRRRRSSNVSAAAWGPGGTSWSSRTRPTIATRRRPSPRRRRSRPMSGRRSTGPGRRRASGSKASGRSRASWASAPSTTSPRRRSSSRAPATRRAPSSPGW